MERWAANTLRVVGIVVTLIATLIGSLILLLLSYCAKNGNIGGGGRNPEQVVPYFIAGIVVLVAGIWIIARLGRAIARSGRGAQAAVAPPPVPGTESLPAHISPASQQAIDRLRAIIATNIGMALLSNAYYSYRYSLSASHGWISVRTWIIVSAISFLIYQLPYGVVLYRLTKKPDRVTFAFALAIPAAAFLHSLATLPMLLRALTIYPSNAIPYLVFLGLDVAILVLAYRANNQLGYQQQPSSIMVAGVAAFLYFSFFGSANTWLYRFIR